MDVLNLDDVIETWAAKQSQKAIGLGTNRSPLYEIDYTRVRFSTEQGSSTTSVPETVITRHPTVTFTSNHENKTDQVQDHTFQMEHSVEATVKTSVTKGFSRNGKVGLKVAVPDQIVKATADFGTVVEVESEEEKTTKHAVKWALHTTVKAQPHHKTTAKLTIKEQEFTCSFTARMKIRGKIVVRIIDGSGSAPLVGNIADIVDKRCKDRDDVTVIDGKVFWDFEGTLNFKFGVSQDVAVESTSLKRKDGSTFQWDSAFKH